MDDVCSPGPQTPLEEVADLPEGDPCASAEDAPRWDPGPPNTHRHAQRAALQRRQAARRRTRPSWRRGMRR